MCTDLSMYSADVGLLAVCGSIHKAICVACPANTAMDSILEVLEIARNIEVFASSDGVINLYSIKRFDHLQEEKRRILRQRRAGAAVRAEIVRDYRAADLG